MTGIHLAAGKMSLTITGSTLPANVTGSTSALDGPPLGRSDHDEERAALRSPCLVSPNAGSWALRDMPLGAGSARAAGVVLAPRSVRAVFECFFTRASEGPVTDRDSGARASKQSQVGSAPMLVRAGVRRRESAADSSRRPPAGAALRSATRARSGRSRSASRRVRAGRELNAGRRPGRTCCRCG